ncbi:hypothetical protein WJX72_001935 [[Myrmecia] bisecta]|uniref:Uncharacterized protein n=1 Tax=[Myrmecia] bisecta TaxID=41462 RepID=A0AAW1Q4L7_9CHLO
MLSQDQLAGIHVGTVWHCDDRGSQRKSKRGSASPRDLLERDATNVWTEQDTSLAGSLPDEAADVRVSQLAPTSLHAAANIPHKDALGLFVPVSNLVAMLEARGQVELALDLYLKEASMSTYKRALTGAMPAQQHEVQRP